MNRLPGRDRVQTATAPLLNSGDNQAPLARQRPTVRSSPTSPTGSQSGGPMPRASMYSIDHSPSPCWRVGLLEPRGR